MRTLNLIVAFSFLILYNVGQVFSHNFTVTNLSPYHISSSYLIQAGDTIFLDPSRTRSILFDRLQGEPDKPIVIINKHGVSHISSGTVNIRLERCNYVKITGTGDKNYKYGIKLSNAIVQALTIGLYCSNVEVDHVEIESAGFSGITAKTDDYMFFAKTEEDKNYVMKNLKLHHNYIHDLRGGEGFYIGHNAYPVDDKGKKQHQIDGIEVYNNLIEYTPREAIQVGACPSGRAKIHHNVIRHYGTIKIDSVNSKPEKDHQQNNGIQLGQGFSGECYNNWIEEGPGKALQIVGTGNVNVYNNVIIKPGEWAFYVGNGRMTIKDHSKINFFHNTIISPGQQAIKFDPQKDSVQGNFYNNLIYNSKGIKDPAGKSGIFTDEKTLKAYNIIEKDASKINFADLKNRNFNIKKGSIAIDKGYNTKQAPIEFSLDSDYEDGINSSSKVKLKRDQNPDIGAYEFREQ